jgi:hypothetical protein
MEWATKDFGRGCRNYGIYNCRTTVGGVNRSIHGDGRACDFGFATIGGRANPVGWDLCRLLLANTRQLGIQMIIWDRTIWSARTPNGAPYGGSGKSPHTDHIHCEQTWHSARTLTRDRVRVIVGGRPAPTPAPSTPPYIPPPPVPVVEEQEPGMIVIRQGKGIAHLVNNRTVGLTVDGLIRVRQAYADADVPLVEIELGTDAEWRWYTGLT